MANWIVAFVAKAGGLGIFLLMLLENVFPPIPSELIMPLAGYHAQTGALNLWISIAFGSAGSLLGTSLWYLLGWTVGEQRLRRWIEKHGKWLTLTTEDVDRSKAWFHRRGAVAVFVCRMIPALRSVISLPAGFSRMPIGKFFLFSLTGTVIWTGALAGAGYLLRAQYQEVSRYVGPVSWIIIGLSVVIYMWRLVRLLRS